MKTLRTIEHSGKLPFGIQLLLYAASTSRQGTPWGFWWQRNNNQRTQRNHMDRPRGRGTAQAGSSAGRAGMPVLAQLCEPGVS